MKTCMLITQVNHEVYCHRAGIIGNRILKCVMTVLINVLPFPGKAPINSGKPSRISKQLGKWQTSKASDIQVNLWTCDNQISMREMSLYLIQSRNIIWGTSKKLYSGDASMSKHAEERSPGLSYQFHIFNNISFLLMMSKKYDKLPGSARNVHLGKIKKDR